MATTAKNKFTDVEGQALRILNSFKEDPTYKKEAAAYKDDIENVLKAAEEVKNANDFYREFVLKEAADIRKLYPVPEQLATNLMSFEEAFTVPTGAIGKLVKVVLAVVRARNAMSEPKAVAKKKKGKA